MSYANEASGSIELKQQLPETGERLLAQATNHFVVVEHLHRYAFAMEYVRDRVVLDIASGEGYGTNLLSGVANQAIGVDISQEAVNFASQKYVQSNLTYKVGRADCIPLPDNAVDVVVSFETLEHHDKHEEMMREVRRVLKPDGLLIMSTPDKSIYHRRDPHNIYHIKELNFQEFKDLIERNFKESIFIEQRIIISSFLAEKKDKALHEDKENSCIFYSGNFNKINFGLDETKEFINQPFFIVCLASERKIASPQASLFDAADVYHELNLRYEKLMANLENMWKENTDLRIPFVSNLQRYLISRIRQLLKKNH